MSGADNFWVRFCHQWPQRLQEVNDITTQFAELVRIFGPPENFSNTCREVYDVIKTSETFWREKLGVEAQSMAEKSESFLTTRDPFGPVLLSCQKQVWLHKLAPFHHGICQRRECQVRPETSYERDRGPYDEDTKLIEDLEWALKQFQTNVFISSQLSGSDRNQATTVLNQLKCHIVHVYHSSASEGLLTDPIVAPVACDDDDSVAGSRPSSPTGSVFTRPSSSASVYSDGLLTYSGGSWT